MRRWFWDLSWCRGVRIALWRSPALYLIQKAAHEEGSTADFIKKAVEINYGVEYKFKITVLQK